MPLAAIEAYFCNKSIFVVRIPVKSNSKSILKAGYLLVVILKLMTRKVAQGGKAICLLIIFWNKNWINRFY